MTYSLPLMLAIGLSTLSEDADAAKKDLARFEGVWRIALVDVEGKKQPEASFASHRVIIKSDGEFVVRGTRLTRGKIKLDATKTPKLFEQTITRGPFKGRVFTSIYEIDGDTYKLCGAFRGGPPPAAFEAKPGSGLMLSVMVRTNQSVKAALVEVERKELAGTWQAVSYALDGKAASPEDMAKIKLSIEPDGRTTAVRAGQPFIATASVLDPMTDPMNIDFAYTLGELKGQTAPGIYKIEDDVLTICRSAPGHARPTTFDSKPGSGHTLMTYKRESEPVR
jgi:uncharacterized protein (TIGR03067 family)